MKEKTKVIHSKMKIKNMFLQQACWVKTSGSLQTLSSIKIKYLGTHGREIFLKQTLNTLEQLLKYHLKVQLKYTKMDKVWNSLKLLIF